MDVTEVECTGKLLSYDEIEIHWKVEYEEGTIKAKIIPQGKRE